MQEHEAQDIDEAEPASTERFEKLADQWEKETVFLSNSSRAAEHPAHREIVSMGENCSTLDPAKDAVPRAGHWFPGTPRHRRRRPGET